jgi:hypothetical protein
MVYRITRLKNTAIILIRLMKRGKIQLFSLFIKNRDNAEHTQITLAATDPDS